MKTLIIDNYDSFTYNLYQLIAEVNNVNPIVIKNDYLTWEELIDIEFDNVVISPGPGHPNVPKDFGICSRAIIELDVPILGVCLGHQGICCAYGVKVVHAPEAMHGRISKVIHNRSKLFTNIPQEFNVVRYHSLISSNELPSSLEKIAWTEDNLVMGVRHKEKPIWGIQFHPESICTEYGKTLLFNFNYISQLYKFKGRENKCGVIL